MPNFADSYKVPPIALVTTDRKCISSRRRQLQLYYCPFWSMQQEQIINHQNIFTVMALFWHRSFAQNLFLKACSDLVSSSCWNQKDVALVILKSVLSFSPIVNSGEMYLIWSRIKAIRQNESNSKLFES